MPNCRLSKEKRKKIWGAMQLALLYINNLKRKIMDCVYVKVIWYKDEWDGMRVDRLTTRTMNEAFRIANAIREKYEKEGYIVEEINIRKK